MAYAENFKNYINENNDNNKNNKNSGEKNNSILIKNKKSDIIKKKWWNIPHKLILQLIQLPI